MKNQYETVFIVTPVLSDIQVKETVKKFRDIITEHGGEIVNEEDWGLRKLAYPIQKKSTGFYQLIEFAEEPTFAKTLETQFRRDERIIRFLTFSKDKHAVAYSEKRISRTKAKTEKEN
jgi:small subunit ribosomal protein S6